MISSYTFGIYPRSEELIEATRKNTENLDSLFQSETEEYISAQKNANLGFVSDPLLKWDDIFRKFIIKNKIGFASKNKDLKRLISDINKISKLSENKKKKIYLSSKKVYEENFNINDISDKLIKILEKVKNRYAEKTIL